MELGEFYQEFLQRGPEGDWYYTNDELDALYDLADGSANPAVQFFYTQFLMGGAYVTRYSGDPVSPAHNSLTDWAFNRDRRTLYRDRDPAFREIGNICVNFEVLPPLMESQGWEPARLPCYQAGPIDKLFGYDPLSPVAEAPAFGMMRDEPQAKARILPKALSRWAVNSSEIPFADAIAIIRDHTADVILVRSLIERIFARISTPEGALAMASILLSIFSTSPDISALERGGFARLVHGAFMKWRDRISALGREAGFLQEVATHEMEIRDPETLEVDARREWSDVTNASRAFIDGVAREREMILAAWDAHVRESAARPYLAREVPRLGLEREAIERSYEKYRADTGTGERKFIWSAFCRVFSNREYAAEAFGGYQLMMKDFADSDPEVSELLNRDLNFVTALWQGDLESPAVVGFFGGGALGPWAWGQIRSGLMYFVPGAKEAAKEAAIAEMEAAIVALRGKAVGFLARVKAFGSGASRFIKWGGAAISLYSIYDIYDSATDRRGVPLMLPAWNAAPAGLMQKRYGMIEDLPGASASK